MVFLASKLSQPEQHQLAKLGELLGGKIADTFSGSVSHVMVPEGHMPTTYSTLLGLLAGCWVVKFSWVEACLQAGKWMPEIEHEAEKAPSAVASTDVACSHHSSMAVSSSSLAPLRRLPKTNLPSCSGRGRPTPGPAAQA
ncbi:BRCA1-associated RING domain protein 1-like [Micropterus salmoides]|uniref:BRCA1-associated RING domain protein 1-like n=1 Tax=Micropterus salmoides TaxID=27706 RepID=UPI0018EA644F|nr:BRCA1-associated RING domain protein 1-like [Micropterus salmoides]